MRNLRYYAAEARTLIRLSAGRAILSVVSLGLLLLFSLISITIWIGASHYVERMKDETQIAVYYTPDLNAHSLGALEESIGSIPGVGAIRRVTREESLAEMRALLRDEAKVLERFAENPFEAYLRAAVSADFGAEEAGAIRDLPHVTYVRDHREVLRKVRRISDIAAWIGGLTVSAAVLSAVMITYFMTVESVLAHRHQIVDLRLMGAPESFITVPFVLQGLIVNLISTILAFALHFAGIKMLPQSLRTEGGLAGAVIGSRAEAAALALLASVLVIGVIASLRAVSSKRNLA